MSGGVVIDLEARWANLQAIMRLERAMGFPLCGMSSRPAAYVVPVLVRYDARAPMIETARRFAGPAFVEDCARWAAWLGQAIAVTRRTADGGREPVPLREVSLGMPAPFPRDFHDVRVWPTLGGSDGGPRE